MSGYTPRLVIARGQPELAEETPCPFCGTRLLLREGPNRRTMVSHMKPTCEGFKARLTEVMGAPLEMHSQETVSVMAVPVGKPGDA